MPTLSLDSVNKRLAKLRAQAAKMEATQSVAKKRSVARVVALMRKLGVSMVDLKTIDAKGAKLTRTSEKKAASKRATQPVAIKYRHPSTNETWTGRGKPPKWLSAEINAGKSKEDFLI